jgi:hypothetical protein
MWRGNNPQKNTRKLVNKPAQNLSDAFKTGGASLMYDLFLLLRLPASSLSITQLRNQLFRTTRKKGVRKKMRK